jgi:hypothetical protein
LNAQPSSVGSGSLRGLLARRFRLRIQFFKKRKNIYSVSDGMTFFEKLKNRLVKAIADHWLLANYPR